MEGAFVWIGSLGVGVLLLAFFLNITGRLAETGRVYLLLNAAGAGLAAYYAWHTGSIPFVILEITWASAALVRLSINTKKAPTA